MHNTISNLMENTQQQLRNPILWKDGNGIEAHSAARSCRWWSRSCGPPRRTSFPSCRAHPWRSPSYLQKHTKQEHPRKKNKERSKFRTNRQLTRPDFKARGARGRTLRGGRGAAGGGRDVGVASVGGRRGGGGVIRRWRRRGHLIRREPRVRRVRLGCRWRRGVASSAGGRGCCGRIHVAGEGGAGAVPLAMGSMSVVRTFRGRDDTRLREVSVEIWPGILFRVCRAR